MTEPQPGFFEVLYTSRALRRFKPDPIPEEVLFQLIDGAIRAPSGQNAQDWRFIVVTDPAIKARMQEWAMLGWTRYQPKYAEDPSLIAQLPRAQRLSLQGVHDLAHNLATVPAIILVTGLKGRHGTPGGSTFPAVQNLLLTARALGLGGSIFNLPMFGREALTELLQVPETNQVYCVVPVGYPTDRQGPVSRKPVRAVAYRDRFGQAWEFAEKQPDTGFQERWVARPQE